MDAKRKYELFRKLLDCNMKAMGSLSGIRDASSCAGNNGEKVVGLYIDALENIRCMADVYCRMRRGGEERAAGKINDVEELTKGVITNLEMLLNFSYDDTELMETALKELAEKVEAISRGIQDPDNRQFSLSSVKTVHDLIRYFHQEAIVEMFNLAEKGGSEDTTSAITVRYSFFNGNTMDLRLLDLGGGVEEKRDPTFEDIRCQPLVEILNGIPAELDYGVRNIGSKSAWAFVAQDYLDFNITMGTHIANISAVLDGNGGGYVMFRFKEWCEHGRKKARMKYLGQILRKLGLKTKAEPSSIEARIEGLSVEKGKEILNQIGRLLVTTDNLDWALVDPEQRENKKVLKACVERFMQGHYDITDYGMSINENPYRKS